jgi:hypothetical protein
MLGISPAYGPDWDCLEEGLRSFGREYHKILHRLGIWRGLMAIGRLSWLDRLQNNNDGGQLDPIDPNPINPATGSDSPEENSGYDWSPGAVKRALTSRIRHCGHLLRRARWLTLLSESSVAWRESENSKRPYRVLVLKDGKVVENGSTWTQRSLPIPPGGARPLAARRSCFDLEVYDRLRVLTTELRRLIVDHRSAVVRLNAKVMLGSDQLERLLKWI